MFKRWRWTYKNAKYRSPLKYTLANRRYYVHYVTGIVRYPLDRIKFLDEARFDAKSLLRKKGVSRAGQPVIRVHGRNGAFLALSMRVGLLSFVRAGRRSVVVGRNLV